MCCKNYWCNKGEFCGTTETSASSGFSLKCCSDAACSVVSLGMYLISYQDQSGYTKSSGASSLTDSSASINATSTSTNVASTAAPSLTASLATSKTSGAVPGRINLVGRLGLPMALMALAGLWIKRSRVAVTANRKGVWYFNLVLCCFGTGTVCRNCCLIDTSTSAKTCYRMQLASWPLAKNVKVFSLSPAYVLSFLIFLYTAWDGTTKCFWLLIMLMALNMCRNQDSNQWYTGDFPATIHYSSNLPPCASSGAPQMWSIYPNSVRTAEIVKTYPLCHIITNYPLNIFFLNSKSTSK